MSKDGASAALSLSIKGLRSPAGSTLRRGATEIVAVGRQRLQSRTLSY
jgi:hypothetical protein